MKFWMTLALAAMMLAPMCASGQRWRTALTAVTVGTLWVDYCQIHEEMDLGYEQTQVLGIRMSYPVLAAVNLSETAINVFAPRRWRPWINLATILYHIPYVLHAANFPVGRSYAHGGRVIHLGVRIIP